MFIFGTDDHENWDKWQRIKLRDGVRHLVHFIIALWSTSWTTSFKPHSLQVDFCFWLVPNLLLVHVNTLTDNLHVDFYIWKTLDEYFWTTLVVRYFTLPVGYVSSVAWVINKRLKWKVNCELQVGTCRWIMRQVLEFMKQRKEQTLS